VSVIVAVHGIGQQLKGEETLRAEWLPALRDGLRRVPASLPNDDSLCCAFYGDFFREKGKKSLGEAPPFDAGDVEDWEHELLVELWGEAARVEPGVRSPEARTKLRAPRTAQRALNALSASAFFAGIAERAVIFDLKQLRRYLDDSAVRQEVQARVAAGVSPETSVLIGHSLGSVVAYEALCAHPEWPVKMLVTLGSPLGIRNLIFERLQPPPTNGVGCWPPSVKRWINIADGGDIVALVKELRPSFGDRVEDRLVHNGATAHSVAPYLTAAETGDAIAAGLRA